MSNASRNMPAPIRARMRQWKLEIGSRSRRAPALMTMSADRAISNLPCPAFRNRLLCLPIDRRAEEVRPIQIGNPIIQVSDLGFGGDGRRGAASDWRNAKLPPRQPA